MSQHGRVTTFYLVNADTENPLRVITNGDTITLSQDGRNLNVCVIVEGAADSVTMGIGATMYPEHTSMPWCLAGDNAYLDTYEPVPELRNPGRYTISATPGLWTDFLTGARGETARITINVVENPPRATASPTEPPTRSPTRTPTARPTLPPTALPTTPPTREPTRSPTRGPTASPTREPTAGPTRKPTNPPTREPTRSPTGEPTRPPTREPTRSPVVIVVPTMSPTPPPTTLPTAAPTTKEPTMAPTKQPTAKPTKRPTEQPVVGQTRQPTEQPTEPLPTPEPTKEPTQEPTSEPIEPTPSPTAAGTPLRETETVTLAPTSKLSTQQQQTTTAPSPAPFSKATEQPTNGSNSNTGTATLSPTRTDTLMPQESETILDLWLQSTTGIMEQRAEFDFQAATAAHIQQEIKRQITLAELAVRANVLTQNPIVPTQQEQQLPATRRRELQQLNPLLVRVYVLSEYRSNVTTHPVKTLMEMAWDTTEQQNSYINRLQQSRSGDFFATVNFVQLLLDGRAPGGGGGGAASGNMDGNNETDTLTGRVLLIAVIAAAAASAILGGIFVLARQRGRQRRYCAAAAAANDNNGSSNKDSTQDGDFVVTSTHVSPVNNNNDKLNNSNTSPYVQEILMNPEKNDDVSTLGEPVVFGGSHPQTRMGTGSTERDERTASVSGVSQDYDYARAYINYGVSVKEEEHESNIILADDPAPHPYHRERTQSHESSTADVSSSTVAQLMKQQRAGSGTLGPALFANDDDSFEQQFHQSDFANEQRFDVVAPAGKLGMVIDTAEEDGNGNPIVHDIKPHSVLAGQVRVGDRLLSVDGEDVTGMKLVDVSCLITQKSDVERIFSFARDGVAQR